MPRYNEFRRLLRLRPIATFAELDRRPGLADELDEVYDGDIEKLDLSVGMFAEKRPHGFAFSDTAFRIFILMARRRLNSDRFFTRDYDARGLHQDGREVDRRRHHDRGAPSALAGPVLGPRCEGQRLPAVVRAGVALIPTVCAYGRTRQCRRR